MTDSGSRLRKPLVGVVCDKKIIEPHPFHVAGDKYIQALISAADVVPVLIPAVAHEHELADWLDHLDGIFLTGAYSMVNPELYDAAVREDMELDPVRDAASMTMIKYALEKVIPLFGACRGFQEMVVATGGTLNQAIHEDKRFNDHREEKGQPLDKQYGQAHRVKLTPGGYLAGILNCETAMVNSLHVQGAESVSDAVNVEAVSEDGLVEAITVKNSRALAMAVQWHPEWKVMEDEVSRKLFAAFGDACKAKR